jgi:hypothetical protein
LLQAQQRVTSACQLLLRLLLLLLLQHRQLKPRVAVQLLQHPMPACWAELPGAAVAVQCPCLQTRKGMNATVA